MMIYVIPDKPSILKYFIYFYGVLDFRVSATFEQPRFHKNVPLAQRERYWHKIEGVDQWLDSRIKEHGLFQNDWCSHNGDDAPGLTRLTAFEFLQKIVLPRRPPLALKITFNCQIFLMSWLKLGLLGSQRLSWSWWSCWRSLMLWSDYDNWGLVYDQLLYHFFQAFCLESLKNSHLGTSLLFSCPSPQFSSSYCLFSSSSSFSSSLLSPSSSSISASSSSSAQLTDTEPLSSEWQQRAQEELQEKKEWRERDIQVFRRTLEG